MPSRPSFSESNTSTKPAAAEGSTSDAGGPPPKEIDYAERLASNLGIPPMPDWFRDAREIGNIEDRLRAVGMNDIDVAGIMRKIRYQILE